MRLKEIKSQNKKLIKCKFNIKNSLKLNWSSIKKI